MAGERANYANQGGKHLLNSAIFSVGRIRLLIRGDGSPRSVDLKSLHLKIGAAEIGPLRSIIVNDGMGPGTYPIDAAFSTNLLSDHEYIVGSA